MYIHTYIYIYIYIRTYAHTHRNRTHTRHHAHLRTYADTTVESCLDLCDVTALVSFAMRTHRHSYWQRIHGFLKCLPFLFCSSPPPIRCKLTILHMCA